MTEACTCIFKYLRPINEQEFHKYIHMISNDSDLIESKVRQKGEICGRITRDGSDYCDIHPGIIIDRKKYFTEFVEWMETDPVVTWSDLNYPIQMNLYRSFVKIIKRIEKLRTYFELEQGQIDISESKFIQVSHNREERKLLKEYYTLLTIDLQELFKQMEYPCFEKRYKDHYATWPCVPMEIEETKPETIPEPKSSKPMSIKKPNSLPKNRRPPALRKRGLKVI